MVRHHDSFFPNQAGLPNSLCSPLTVPLAAAKVLYLHRLVGAPLWLLGLACPSLRRYARWLSLLVSVPTYGIDTPTLLRDLDDVAVELGAEGGLMRAVGGVVDGVVDGLCGCAALGMWTALLSILGWVGRLVIDDMMGHEWFDLSARCVMDCGSVGSA